MDGGLEVVILYFFDSNMCHTIKRYLSSKMNFIHYTVFQRIPKKLNIFLHTITFPGTNEQTLIVTSRSVRMREWRENILLHVLFNLVVMSERLSGNHRVCVFPRLDSRQYRSGTSEQKLRGTSELGPRSFYPV